MYFTTLYESLPPCCVYFMAHFVLYVTADTHELILLFDEFLITLIINVTINSNTNCSAAVNVRPFEFLAFRAEGKFEYVTKILN